MSRHLTIAVSLLILFFCSLAVALQPAANRLKLKGSQNLAITDAGAWKPIYKGIEFRTIAVERSDPDQSIELKLLRFDTQRIIPRVLRSAQLQLKGASARAFAEKSGALAAINANYFDIDGKPLAFLKTAGQTVNARISASSLYTGVFGVKEQRPFIVPRTDFSPDEVDEGLQSGPLLLSRGNVQPVTGVANRVSRRALIGIDAEQKLIIGVTDSLVGGLFWQEAQELFSAPQWKIQTVDLLNLDGGGSAQLYAKAGSFEVLVPGTTDVPVAIGFFARSASQ